jgi:hypothetical protein
VVGELLDDRLPAREGDLPLPDGCPGGVEGLGAVHLVNTD